MYKEMLYCSVCNLRRKGTVLTRCGHLFCSQCVQDCVRTRNRCCPACKTPFGTKDMLRVRGLDDSDE
ncbi:MAG: hypothetical protein MHM6MM_006169 [Cercozoa sp. M6MM]